MIYIALLRVYDSTILRQSERMIRWQFQLIVIKSAIKRTQQKKQLVQSDVELTFSSFQFFNTEWHKLSVSVSHHLVQLYIDCDKVGSSVIPGLGSINVSGQISSGRRTDGDPVTVSLHPIPTAQIGLLRIQLNKLIPAARLWFQHMSPFKALRSKFAVSLLIISAKAHFQ